MDFTSSYSPSIKKTIAITITISCRAVKGGVIGYVKRMFGDIAKDAVNAAIIGGMNGRMRPGIIGCA